MLLIVFVPRNALPIDDDGDDCRKERRRAMLAK
jgi:hypothetical protein